MTQHGADVDMVSVNGTETVTVPLLPPGAAVRCALGSDVVVVGVGAGLVLGVGATTTGGRAVRLVVWLVGANATTPTTMTAAAVVVIATTGARVLRRRCVRPRAGRGSPRWIGSM